MPRRGFLLVTIALTMAAAAPAKADDVEICIDRKNKIEVQYPACLRVIAAAQAQPKDLAFAYRVRAENFARKFDFDRAIADYDAAIKLEPNADNYNNRGLMWKDKGEADRGIADFTEALRIDPKYSWALSNRGIAYSNKGEFDRAIVDYDAAMKISRFAAAYGNRAYAQYMKGDFERAIADYSEALRINPKSYNSMLGLCRTRVAMAQFDAAIEQCNLAFAAAPPNARFPAAFKVRADAHLGKDDLTAALADYDKSLELSPNSVEAYVGRGRLFEKRNDPNRARADYRSAAFALTRFDDVETQRARVFARERLNVLTKAQGPVTPGRRIALVVGNSGYANVSPLANPARDAKMIADTLRGIGFQSVTVAGDLTRDKFFETLRNFARDAEKAEWALVYYAGHGLEIGGVNYLVPVDAKLKSDRDAAAEAVALEQVIASVQGARKLRLVMLDACRDNPFAKQMQRTIALRLVNKGLSNIEPDAGFMVVYAAKHGETAADGEGANSPFAIALARNIKAGGGIEVRKLFDIVRDDVIAATKKQQQPFAYGSLPGREDFFFVAGK